MKLYFKLFHSTNCYMRGARLCQEISPLKQTGGGIKYEMSVLSTRNRVYLQLHYIFASLTSFALLSKAMSR